MELHRRSYLDKEAKQLLDSIIAILIQDMKDQVSSGRAGPREECITYENIYQLINRGLIEIIFLPGKPRRPELQAIPLYERIK